MREDIILLLIWCWHHRKRTWQVMRIDGVMVCLECRAEGQEVSAPFLSEGVH